MDHPKVVDPERFVMELVRADGVVREDVALRVEELARKSTDGTLTPEERDEYARIVEMNHKLMEMRIESEKFWEFMEKTGGTLPPGSIDRP